MAILAIGDLHFKWVCHRTLDKFFAAIEKQQKIEPIKTVVQVGDIYDFYSWARFDKAFFVDPAQELYQSLEYAQAFFTELRALTPRAQRFVIKGNHDDRVRKTAERKAPELLPFVEHNSLKLYDFKGFKLKGRDSKDEFFFQNICYIHGYLTKLGDHVKKIHRNVICGHTHRGGVFRFPLKNEVLWELNCGYLADPDSKVMDYRFLRKTKDWTKGFGIVDFFGPRFVCLE